MSSLEQAIADLRALIDQRFDAVDRRFDAVDQKFAGVDQRFEEMRSHFTILIDSVRDDVRIFAEAHIALEQRMTRVEARGQ